ncbi:MAG: hypothetical protein D6743_17035 [Calditrichaeota bacterium]|nr:MAG: hypothetical protein D6743_17035 [Calditrichota bacterium]
MFLKSVGICLLGLTLSLLLVGVISGTPVRHAIQVVPALIAFLAVVRRTGWAVHAARPLFLFWLFIVLAIWLYLLDIANFVSGRFTPAEVMLTVVIGVSCLWGLVASFRVPSDPVVGHPAVAGRTRVVTWAGFALLQTAALWVSLQPAFAQR